MRAEYPKLPVIVCNTGAPLDFDTDDLVTVLYRPDLKANVSAARNACVDALKTPYALVSDDDHWFTPRTDLHAWVSALNQHQLDILGGMLMLDGREQHWEGDFTDSGTSVSVQRRRFTDFNVHRVGVVLNFFVARADVLRAHKWDEDIPIAGEHVDYFYRAWKVGLRVGYCARFVALHVRHTTPTYQTMRNRRNLTVFTSKHGKAVVSRTRGSDRRADVRNNRQIQRAAVRDIAVRRRRRVPKP